MLGKCDGLPLCHNNQIPLKVFYYYKYLKNFQKFVLINIITIFPVMAENFRITFTKLVFLDFENVPTFIGSGLVFVPG